jgi:biotin carboxylase
VSLINSKEVVVIIFRGEWKKHLEVLEQAVRAVSDSGLVPVCIAPHAREIPPDIVSTVYRYDTESALDSLIVAVRDISERFLVTRIIALAEQDVQPAARLRDLFGIEGMRSRESLYFRDKNAMAARAAEEGVRVAESCQPHTLKTILDFTRRVGFPIVIKPYDGVSCVNTHKARNADELEQLWPSIEEQRHDYRVEGFVHGRQFHVDAVVRHGEVVFEGISEYTDTVLDHFGKGPLGSIAHAGTRDARHLKMMALNRQIISLFGLSTGVSHTEFYLQDDGTVVFGETAARMVSGWSTRLYEGAYGIELAYTWVRTEIDPDYHWTPPAEPRYAAAEFLWTPTAGRIESITRQEELAALPGMYDVQLWKHPGDVIGPSTGSRGQDLGRVIVTGGSAAEVQARMAEVRRVFRVTCV